MGVIIQCHQQWVSKGSVGLIIPKIGRVITVWDEVFFKLRMSLYGLLISKKVFSVSSHLIETHIDVVVEVLEVQSSVAFELCLNEVFIEFWWSDLMFEIWHATIFCRISTFQWWCPLELLQPQMRKINSGYHNYQLTGPNLRYKYFSQNQFSG